MNSLETNLVSEMFQSVCRMFFFSSPNLQIESFHDYQSTFLSCFCLKGSERN